jgi:hypothetical protein
MGMVMLETLYAVTVFLSSFLLFQIQPIIAKMILPWFGGTSSVWNTCMLFFQVMLLGGYLYAHWLGSRSRARWQAGLHSVLLTASLLALPVIANPSWRPGPADNPSLRILGLLAATVGLPYFMVSTTSSLLQAWYARTHAGVIPYRLFALSNLASMLALVSYPLVVEPALATRSQAQIWSIGYAAFAILCSGTAWLSASRMKAPAATSDDEATEAPRVRLRLLWAALAASASILLLSITTFLTQDVAAVPMLWIAPLATYLLSFILCFEGAGGYYKPRLYIPLAMVSLAVMGYRLGPFPWDLPMIATIGIFIAALFACCMVCHGELAARKPHPRYLTGFYVMISLGGAAGGLFVGLVAPNFFKAYYEFPIGLALCAGLLMLLAPRPIAAWKRVALAAALAGYFILLAVSIVRGQRNYLAVERNFYGQLRVWDVGKPYEKDSYRAMAHGTVNHGEQMLNALYRRRPVSYFCPESGIGRAMAARPAETPQRVGILGLGCGGLVAYVRPGETWRIYEINPQVPELANAYFTYLSDTPAKVEIALGDGRLSLEREPEQRFDLLVMDAFSGDSVPVHLITREAFETYFRRLNPGGLLAVNISNRYLDLRSVIERAASSFGRIAIAYSHTPPDDDIFCYATMWVLVAEPAIRETAPELVKGGEILPSHPNFRIWTDDFSNMWSILK